MVKILIVRGDNDIILRKVGMSYTFVIMNKSTNHEILKEIIQDSNKFLQLRSDPTESIKKRVNELAPAFETLPNNNGPL